MNSMLDGVSSGIVKYYKIHGLPGAVVSVRCATLEECDSVSICFANHHWRHVWRNVKPLKHKIEANVAGWWMHKMPVR